jgi:hypothetical protein
MKQLAQWPKRPQLTKEEIIAKRRRGDWAIQVEYSAWGRVDEGEVQEIIRELAGRRVVREEE